MIKRFAMVSLALAGLAAPFAVALPSAHAAAPTTCRKPVASITYRQQVDRQLRWESTERTVTVCAGGAVSFGPGAYAGRIVSVNVEPGHSLRLRTTVRFRSNSGPGIAAVTTPQFAGSAPVVTMGAATVQQALTDAGFTTAQSANAI